MKKEDIAAYNKAYRWKKEPLKIRSMGHGRAGKERRKIWIVKDVQRAMRKWITDKMIEAAERQVMQKNSQL